MIQGDAGTDKHDIHLLGWTGDYNDPDNFVGVFFGGKSAEWGFDNPELFSALRAARELPTRDEQAPAYEKINAADRRVRPGRPAGAPGPVAGLRQGRRGLRRQPGAGRGLEQRHRRPVI